MMKRQIGIGLILLGVSSPAFALSTLKQVQFSSGDQIDLLFDGKVTKNQIRTEFFNDIIQVSLTDAAVYPAKISTVNGQKVSKIFAYQYAPKLIRCRLTVKGSAEAFKDKIQVQSSGKTLSIRLTGAKTDQLVTHSAQAVSTGPEPSSDADEKALLEKVMQAPAPVQAPQKAVAAAGASIDKQKQEPLATGKPLASPSRALIKMTFVLALFGVCAWVLKKFIFGKVRSAGALGALNRFARNKFGSQGKIIEVISNHYLGPKKSICVVKIAGRMMVLGITDESINLISQLAPGSQLSDLDAAMGDDEVGNGIAAAVTGAGAVAGGPAQFSDVLDREHGKPVYSAATISRSTPTPPSLSGVNSIREKIRSKMEGMKPL